MKGFDQVYDFTLIDRIKIGKGDRIAERSRPEGSGPRAANSAFDAVSHGVALGNRELKRMGAGFTGFVGDPIDQVAKCEGVVALHGKGAQEAKA